MLPLWRIGAYAIDWCLFALWGGIVFTVSWFSQGDDLSWPANPWLAQALGFSLTTLPFGLYFALTEGSARQATIGKRAVGLRVVTVTGGRPTRWTTMGRAATKLLPWELGHMALYQLTALSPTEDAPPWLWLPMAASLALAAWYVISLWSTSARTPYDRIAGTRVVRESSPKPATVHPEDSR